MSIQQPPDNSGMRQGLGVASGIQNTASNTGNTGTLTGQSSGVDNRVITGTTANLLIRPTSIAGTGLSQAFIADLALKAIYNMDTVTGADLAEHLKLPYNPILEEILGSLRKEQMVEVGTGSGYAAASFSFRVTDKGRERARLTMERSGWVGAAPVPLEAYNAIAGISKHRKILPESVRTALSHLILPQSLLDQLGIAVNAGGSIFIFGKPGNGKTAIAEALSRMLPNIVYVPRAIEVDGHVIKVFDPQVHHPFQAGQTGPLANMRLDDRWVACHPPTVVAGGELMLEDLELKWGEKTHYYEASIQIKSNGGVLLIDDLGRQRCSPQELLNRWIVPLEKGIDYLTMHTGKQIVVPFTQLVVFSTNLSPEDLVDDAFLRRILNKVEIGDPDPRLFREILMRQCQILGIEYSDAGLEYLLREQYYNKKRPLRACHPRDLLRLVISIANYYGRSPALTPPLLDAACAIYFIRESTPNP